MSGVHVPLRGIMAGPAHRLLAIAWNPAPGNLALWQPLAVLKGKHPNPDGGG